ncbi:MAG: sorbosone dehydrogenase family protein, partial [Dehalococcoidia bacterium]
MPPCRPGRGGPLLALLAAIALIAACGGASGFVPGPPLDVEPEAPVIPPDPTADDGISLPPGFLAYEFADGLTQPTSLAFDPFGRLFVAELRGKVKVIEDRDGDGLGDSPQTFWSDPDERFTLGLAIAPDGSVYISINGDVIVLRDSDGDGSADEEHVIISGLPHRVHQNNGLAFGPDGKLYIANGSTCNLCHEEDERSAAILRSNLDGSDLEVYARGLRNPYDLAFDSAGGLWATANEHDFFEPAEDGLTLLRDPPDELNYIVEGGHYGWPECAGRDLEMADGGCRGKLAPVAEMAPHSSTDGLAYYDAAHFPAQYRGSLFAAQYGNDERSDVAAGREIVRVQVTPSQGSAPLSATVTRFAAGFDRPLDVTVDALGTLYVADFGSGKIYRIVW